MLGAMTVRGECFKLEILGCLESSLEPLSQLAASLNRGIQISGGLFCQAGCWDPGLHTRVDGHMVVFTADDLRAAKEFEGAVRTRFPNLRMHLGIMRLIPLIDLGR